MLEEGNLLTRDTTVTESLTELLQAPDLRNGDVPMVFITPDDRHTTNLNELRERAMHFAGGLRELGVKPRDRVSVQMPNCAEAIIVQLAALMLDAVLVPVVPVFSTREMTQMFSDAHPSVHVTLDRWRKFSYPEIVAELADDVRPPAVIVAGEAPAGTIGFSDVESAPKLAEWAAGDDDTTSLIIYTSGSTGVPKGVQHTRRTTYAEAVDSDYRAHGSDSDYYLHTGGAGHIGGYIYPLRVLAYGTRILVLGAFDAPLVADVIEEFRPTSMTGMIFYLSQLLDLAENESRDVSSLRLAMTGGSPVPPALYARGAASGMTVVNSYGLSELPTVSISDWRDPIGVRAATAGRATGGNQIRIVAEDGTVLGAGQRGEIQVRGPELFIGYTNVPLEDTFTPDGWFPTGDIGELDSAGRLSIVDRKKNIIIRGGENLSASEIEAILGTHPGIVEAAVIAVPDERYGERVCAFVVARDGYTIDLRNLMDHFVAQGSTKQKIPEYLEFIQALPRTGTGKVDKQQLVAIRAASS